MSISLNNVNSEVVRAHKRIDDINKTHVLFLKNTDSLGYLRDSYLKYSVLIVMTISSVSKFQWRRVYGITIPTNVISYYKGITNNNPTFMIPGNEDGLGRAEDTSIRFTSETTFDADPDATTYNPNNILAIYGIK